jgi:hypothetical protein
LRRVSQIICSGWLWTRDLIFKCKDISQLQQSLLGYIFRLPFARNPHLTPINKAPGSQVLIMWFFPKQASQTFSSKNLKFWSKNHKNWELWILLK